jgi:hypothetical protein
VAAQDLPGFGELRLPREIGRVPEIEHHWRMEKEARASLDLLSEFRFKRRVAQVMRAYYHDGKDRALHEIARHPKTDPTLRELRDPG